MIKVFPEKKHDKSDLYEPEPEAYANPDPYFIVPKLLYFLLNWMIYSTHAFLPHVLKSQWGITDEMYNLSFIFYVFNFFGAMLWGTIADKTRKFKLIAGICVLMTSLFVVLLAFPPPFEGIPRSIYFFFLCSGNFFFSAGTFPIIDSIALSMLTQDPTAGKDAIGQQKAFGTIAHSINTKVIHYFYEHFGEDYNIMFYSLMMTMVPLFMTLLYFVPDSLKITLHKHHHAPAHDKKPAGAEASAAADSCTSISEPAEEAKNPALGLLRRPAFVLFLSVILIAGLVRCVNTNNHSLYLTDYLYVDKGDIGDLMMYFRLPFELGLLFFAKPLMAKTGPYWFMMLGQLAGVVRIAGYLIVKPDHGREGFGKAVLIVLEILKGINSSMISASMVRLANDLAPKEWGGTAQTLVAGVWQGASMALSAVVGYLVLKPLELTLWHLFMITSVIGLAGFVYIFFYYSTINPVLFKKVHAGK